MSGVAMKKYFLLLLVICFASFNLSYANDLAPQDLNTGNKKQITFLYINGSNDYSGKNRLEFKEHFTKKVNAMHPYMMKAFNEDETARKTLLKNGEIQINPEPAVFYWGDKSYSQVSQLDEKISVASVLSPKLSKAIRSAFAHCLHDAVWVQKYSNMSGIIDELHVRVKQETDKGNQVILLGYSAGSFITYNYFLNKFISLNPEEIIAHEKYDEMKKLLGKDKIKPTCLDALMESDLVTLDINGHYKNTLNKKLVLQNYPVLNEKTKTTCFQDNDVRGVINFASPMSLFYSEVSDDKSDLNFLSKQMYKHILESDIFWITVNYMEDPLGFPTAKNMNKAQIDEMTLTPIKLGGGFVYDDSNVRSYRSFITAHLAYWDTQKRFTKAVIKAYQKGYKNLYNAESL